MLLTTREGMERMDKQQVLKELDAIYRAGDIRRMGAFLEEKIREAEEEGDWGTQIMLGNEQMGYFRELGQTKEAIRVFSWLDDLFRKHEMTGTVPYASTLQNAANVYRVDGQMTMAAVYFQDALDIFYQYLEPGDYRFAGLFNNLSLVYLEQKDLERAREYSEKALSIIEKLPDTRSEQAINHVNLADLCCQMNALDQASEHLDAAEKLFAGIQYRDPHYSSLLSARGEICVRRGELKEAENYFRQALAEIEKYYGKNRAWQVVQGNLAKVLRQKET